MLNKLKRAAAMLLILVYLATCAARPSLAEQPQVGTGTAEAALLIEANSGAVLFEKNSGEKLPAAGLSRLPALLVICEAFDAGEIGRDAVITVDDRAAKIGGTTAFLRAGEQINAESLLLAAVMINAGDAIHALACTLCGSETAAAERITSRMAELGVDCCFTDVCGAGQTFSAAELAKLGAALIKSHTYSEFGTKYYEIIHHTGAGDTELANPNKLVKQYSGCIGVGTGSAKDAGYCGVFAAKRGETACIAVLLGAANGSERFATAVALLDHGFSAYRSVRICAAGESFGTVPVRGSMKTELEVTAEDALTLLLRFGESGYKTETELPDYAEAPIKKGDTLGSLVVRAEDGTVLGSAALIAAEDAPRLDFPDCFGFLLALFLRRV